MKDVAIVEYGMGNIDSVVRTVAECGGTPIVTADAAVIASAQAIILPGVGSFSLGMRNLRANGLDVLLTDVVMGRGVPFLGICLGMQLMATTGAEGGETAGLGWLKGHVERLVVGGNERLPHVGWNEVHLARPSALIAEDLSGRDFYFTHSFVVRPAEAADVVATTPYGGGFVSAVQTRSAWGVQFHPEKSQRAGHRLMRAFLAMGAG